MFLLRLFDICFSLLILIVLSPVLLLISIFVIFDGFPIFYLSKRVGKHGKLFTMLKFRSMRQVKDKKIDDSKRLNNLGIFLRRTSLDELPQLFNVLIGDMSLVGPRALPVEIEKNILKKKKFLRRAICPGISGLSQINYSGKKRSLKEKTKLDLKYVKNISIIYYFRILFMTLFVIIRRYKGNKKGYSL